MPRSASSTIAGGVARTNWPGSRPVRRSLSVSSRPSLPGTAGWKPPGSTRRPIRSSREDVACDPARPRRRGQEPDDPGNGERAIIEAMSLQTVIEQKLREALAPAHLEVINESHMHSSGKNNPAAET